MTEHEEPGRERGAEPAAGLDPIGRALRATYSAENHDTLGSDLTGLMLELARVEQPLPAAPAIEPQPAAVWFRRLFNRARD